MKHPKLWAVIPAAGSGQRFSKTELKQYQLIAGQTVLEHSIDRLNHLPLAGYVLAVSKHDSYIHQLKLNQKSPVHFCWGGAERVNSVLNALQYLQGVADDEDWILVHDAARPCIRPENLEQLYQTAVDTQQSAILATPVRDTLKKMNAFMIQHTVSREHLWQAQTPQIAQYRLLKHALLQSLNNHVITTDEASALEYIGAPVHIVQGSADNIKITYSEDLLLAELILQSQKRSIKS